MLKNKCYRRKKVSDVVQFRTPDNAVVPPAAHRCVEIATASEDASKLAARTAILSTIQAAN